LVTAIHGYRSIAPRDLPSSRQINTRAANCNETAMIRLIRVRVLAHKSQDWKAVADLAAYSDISSFQPEGHPKLSPLLELTLVVSCHRSVRCFAMPDFKDVPPSVLNGDLGITPSSIAV
jgi:hypothetical protein